jgi:3-hydroxymyristoyl/3-hydroxydecanoyl-(acyl carrier protein) dehydratase
LATAERVFPADHPAMAGHFPGHPVVPGALLLGEALRTVAAELGMDLSICRVRSAKFMAPVRPGERIVIEFSGSGARAARFACIVGGRTALRGEVSCGAEPTAS